ncbi:hypothetical protein CASbig_52 [Mycobacterium phage CASbig]|uniref:hypothetical protein n=1 Tax=Mycobacterium phage CASbig TaxID=1327035 RepID=UPI00032B3716|nr:hypothetical protein JMN56_gp52 [Mycobacterium phage CASbig]AGK88098.1 hypothetical protein CASbig_52 [Mycobacterium phage CASbig]
MTTRALMGLYRTPLRPRWLTRQTTKTQVITTTPTETQKAPYLAFAGRVGGFLVCGVRSPRIGGLGLAAASAAVTDALVDLVVLAVFVNGLVRAVVVEHGVPVSAGSTGAGSAGVLVDLTVTEAVVRAVSRGSLGDRCDTEPETSREDARGSDRA